MRDIVSAVVSALCVLAVVITACFLLLLWFAPSSEGAPRTEYMPCAQEDQANCVWDARHQGNGEGQSFFTGRDGVTHYLPHHIAHYLLAPSTDRR